MSFTRIRTNQGGIPSGGTGGQTLTKIDGTDYNVDWETGSGGGSGGVPSTIHVLTTRAESSLDNEFSLATLIDGILKHSVSAGVSTPAIAIPGTDYYKPGSSGALDTISGLSAGNANTLQSVSGVWAARTPTQARATLGLVVGADVEAWDADLDTIAGLTPGHNNTLQSVSSVWAARTPSQARVALGLVIGTDILQYDSDLQTIGGLTPNPNYILQSVSGIWAARSPSQVFATLPASTGITANQQLSGPSMTFDGGGLPALVGTKGGFFIPYSGTITGWYLSADATDTISIEVRKCTFAQYDAGSTHPVTGDKINASAPPATSAAKKATSSDLTGWTTTFSAGDYFEFVLSAGGTATKITVVLIVSKS